VARLKRDAVDAAGLLLLVAIVLASEKYGQWVYLVPVILLVLVAGALAFLRVVNPDAVRRLDHRLRGAANPGKRELAARRAVSAEVRREVWRRDQGRCVRCGSRENLEFDHIIPISKGGSNTARNIELLCQSCNRSKGAKIQ